MEAPPAVTLEAHFAALRADLATAVARPGHPWRTPVLATGGAAPDGRVVVLRRFECDPDCLVCFTDVRSPKVVALRQDPRAVWVFYDPETRRQLRVTTTVTIHCDDRVAAGEWAAVGEVNRREYASVFAPGALWNDATTGPLESTVAARNFAVLRCRVVAWDCLMLGGSGTPHQRFGWSADGGHPLTP